MRSRSRPLGCRLASARGARAAPLQLIWSSMARSADSAERERGTVSASLTPSNFVFYLPEGFAGIEPLPLEPAGRVQKTRRLPNLPVRDSCPKRIAARLPKGTQDCRSFRATAPILTAQTLGVRPPTRKRGHTWRVLGRPCGQSRSDLYVAV